MSIKDHRPMGRREFLIVSSATAIATAAVGPRAFATGAAGSHAELTAAAPQRLIAGFAPLDRADSVRSAASIPAADGRFAARGARISVSGASGAPADPRARRAVDLLARYSYFDGGEWREAPFRAWSSCRVTGCQGSPISFTIPVEDTRRIVFTVEAERGMAPGEGATRREALMGSPTESTLVPVVLSLLDDPAALKLARGFYVLVPMFESDVEPRWSSYALRTRDGRWALHDAAGNPASFEHFVLRVDYAKA